MYLGTLVVQGYVLAESHGPDQGMPKPVWLSGTGRNLVLSCVKLWHDLSMGQAHF